MVLKTSKILLVFLLELFKNNWSLFTRKEERKKKGETNPPTLWKLKFFFLKKVNETKI